ncbi:N-alpha-acetyltransferase 30-like isoform X2 [Acanthaster planci]|uniref:N-alpha-acetyltransferase 30-like isoform X2 n=1 Tax=Acanthaster planci TaxID=133434 RepID=A0A8B7XSX8_ACAPL|nr:N-alpha-acetyltransferase 30-like isoform X2 [Acanthaster planci]
MLVVDKGNEQYNNEFFYPWEAKRTSISYYRIQIRAMHQDKCVGAIVCKLDIHKKMARRGYIAMLAVDENYRKLQIGSSLVKKAIRAMVRGECDEVVLETEITNKPALRLYENLGFLRDKRLFRYYLNGVDALRLKLWLR